MMGIKYLSLLALGVAALGCSPALPLKESPEVCATSLSKAQEAAEDARLAAEEAKASRAVAEKLYAEAKALAEQAKGGTEECKSLVAKIEKKRAANARRRRAAAKRSAKSATAKPVIEETSTSAAKREPKYPKYSPSDAPPGWKGE